MKIILLTCLILAVYTNAGALDRIKTSAINAISNGKYIFNSNNIF